MAHISILYPPCVGRWCVFPQSTVFLTGCAPITRAVSLSDGPSPRSAVDRSTAFLPEIRGMIGHEPAARRDPVSYALLQALACLLFHWH